MKADKSAPTDVRIHVFVCIILLLWSMMFHFACYSRKYLLH